MHGVSFDGGGGRYHWGMFRRAVQLAPPTAVLAALPFVTGLGGQWE